MGRNDSLGLRNVLLDTYGTGVEGTEMHDSEFEDVYIKNAKRGIVDKRGKRNRYKNIREIEETSENGTILKYTGSESAFVMGGQ